MTGCGNSLLGEELYRDGYHNVINTDISPSVIESMSKHCEICSKMKWKIMDCLNLPVENHSFDVVLEKATTEVFLVDQISPWDITESAKEIIGRMMNQIERVLKPETGQFFSISFTAPHFKRILMSSCFPKTLKLSDVFELGDRFHFFMYCFSNNATIIPKEVFRYEPPKFTSFSKNSSSEDEEDDTKMRNFFDGFDL